MAKFDGKFIRGLVGEVILRELNGVQIMQGRTSKPKIKRTPATKKAADVFGKASNLSTYIRDGFYNLTRSNYDGMMSKRFNAEVLGSLRSALVPATQMFEFEPNSFNRLMGFEFNIKSPFKDNFFAQPLTGIYENQLFIGIPEMNVTLDMKFPKGIDKCKLVIGHMMLDLLYGHYSETKYAVLDIERGPDKNPIIPARTVQFEVQPGCLNVVTIGLQFIESTFIGDTIINDKQFNPVAILGAFIGAGEIDRALTDQWTEMTFKTFLPPLLQEPAT